MRSLWVSVFAVGAAGSAHAQAALGAYDVDPSAVTVSGISSGGFMAVQLQVAYSSRFFGTAIFAGGPYGCAATASTGACTGGIGLNVASMVTYTNNHASSGTIDPVADLAGKPIYMFSGTGDLVVSPKTMAALQQYYASFTSAPEITFNNTTAAEHAWISPDATDSCSTLASPFINNCNFDAEQTFLQLFYGTLAPKNTGTLTGSFIQFDQNTFCPGGSCSGISMDKTGWVFVPPSCASGQSCRLIIALHGCLQYQGAIGQKFVQQSGLNEWADTNGIIVLYPQTTTSLSNSEGCWDWWGYTNSSYDVKNGVQMTAIMGMVDKIVSGHTGGAPAAPTHLAVTGTTSSSVSLSWSPSAGATSYTLYRNSLSTASGAATSFTDTGLVPSTTYMYQVTASNGSGESAKSSPVQVTTLALGEDGGTGGPDAGPGLDAGSSGGGDSGQPEADAGTGQGGDGGNLTRPDGGSTGGGAGGGCGCSAQAAGRGLMTLLGLAMAAVYRARRRAPFPPRSSR
jgi:MYXO-CTERM domain-containing protein